MNYVFIKDINKIFDIQHLRQDLDDNLPNRTLPGLTSNMLTNLNLA